MNLAPLLKWSKSEFSHLPWREDRSLYRTLVSEIMLQQTTVSTVKNHFERFLLEFPDLKSLAAATESELLVAWKGLGYYRRARSLKKIAEAIVSNYKGKFPEDSDSLTEIPGIGPYTANALIGIGMDKKALAVDANLERVIARLFQLESVKGPKLQKEIQELFIQKKIFNSKVSFRGLNEALMDVGRTYCQARKASCELCPLKKECLSFAAGSPLKFPIEGQGIKKKSVEHELHLLRVFIIKKDKILVYKKNEGEWLAGQYEAPTFVLKSSDKKIKQYPFYQSELTQEALFSFVTGITKYKIKNTVCLMSEKEFKKIATQNNYEWRLLEDKKSNFSTATLKAIAKLAHNHATN